MSFPKEFLHQFTEEFLEKIYGETKYFNIKHIASEAKEAIIKRANILKQLEEDYPKIIEILLKVDKKHHKKYKKVRKELNTLVEKKKIDEDDLFEVTHAIEDELFAHDLFVVTSIPMAFAYSLCEGCTPANDCITENVSKVNYKFNMKLLKEPFVDDDDDINISEEEEDLEEDTDDDLDEEQSVEDLVDSSEENELQSIEDDEEDGEEDSDDALVDSDDEDIDDDEDDDDENVDDSDENNLGIYFNF